MTVRLSLGQFVGHTWVERMQQCRSWPNLRQIRVWIWKAQLFALLLSSKRTERQVKLHAVMGTTARKNNSTVQTLFDWVHGLMFSDGNWNVRDIKYSDCKANGGSIKAANLAFLLLPLLLLKVFMWRKGEVETILWIVPCINTYHQVLDENIPWTFFDWKINELY